MVFCFLLYIYIVNQLFNKLIRKLIVNKNRKIFTRYIMSYCAIVSVTYIMIKIIYKFVTDIKFISKLFSCKNNLNSIFIVETILLRLIFFYHRPIYFPTIKVKLINIGFFNVHYFFFNKFHQRMIIVNKNFKFFIRHRMRC